MKLLFESWQKYLNEEELNEVSEEELEDIDGILHNLKPEDLSFGNIFGEKMRLVTPMKAKDKNLQALKKLLAKSGYEPDFSTGLAIYYSFTMPSLAGQTTIILSQEQKEQLLDGDDIKPLYNDTPERFEKRKKMIQKKQIKIGKLLKKGARLYDNARAAWTASDEINPTQFGLEPDLDKEYDEENVEKYRAAASEMKDKSKKAQQKLFDVFHNATSNAVSAYNIYQKLAEWWNKKSAFYRENPEEATGDATVSSEYSIVYSRHPIDVLRMSDYDNIYSCHSPPSRGDASFYKCAVTEAHGHAPIAYVVENIDLDNLIDESELPEGSSYQDLLDHLEENDEELFEDMERGTGAIDPVSRVRFGKYINSTLKVSLAVPSVKVYGKPFPLLLKDVAEWAKEHQAATLDKIENSKDADISHGDVDKMVFDGDGDILLSNWVRTGGSYQDHDDRDSERFHRFLGVKSYGSAKYDPTEEESYNPTRRQSEQWNHEINNITNNYNNRWHAMRIEAYAEDEDDSTFIVANAKLVLVFDESDFVKSAFQDGTRNAIRYLDTHFEETLGVEWPSNDINYSTATERSENYQNIMAIFDDDEKKDIKSVVYIELGIDLAKLAPDEAWNSDYVDGYVVHEPGTLSDICQRLERIDNDHKELKESATKYFQKEGIFKAPAIYELSQAWHDESWYEWSFEETESEIDYGFPGAIEMSTNVHVNLEDLIKQIPITFDHQPDKSAEIYIMFDDKPIAMAARRDDGEGKFVDFEVRSPEFDADIMNGFKNMDDIKYYAQWNVAATILRPKSGMMTSHITGNKRTGESTHDYSSEVRLLMRQAAGGTDNEFKFPNSSMWVEGPWGDDEWRMVFSMKVDEENDEDIVRNGWEIATETDDEDILKEIFRTAFAKVAKIPGASIKETRDYFKKFDYF